MDFMMVLLFVVRMSGTPAYKSQEEYYDDILMLKKVRELLLMQHLKITVPSRLTVCLNYLIFDFSRICQPFR